MAQQNGPKGFLVVLPGEIIEIPQDDDKSWLTLFYSLPVELAEKWKPTLGLPRSPYIEISDELKASVKSQLEEMNLL